MRGPSARLMLQRPTDWRGVNSSIVPIVLIGYWLFATRGSAA